MWKKISGIRILLRWFISSYAIANPRRENAFNANWEWSKIVRRRNEKRTKIPLESVGNYCHIMIYFERIPWYQDRRSKPSTSTRMWLSWSFRKTQLCPLLRSLIALQHLPNGCHYCVLIQSCQTTEDLYLFFGCLLLVMRVLFQLVCLALAFIILVKRDEKMAATTVTSFRVRQKLRMTK